MPQGFTLIELLMIITIVGILSGVSVPTLLGYRGKAEEAAFKAGFIDSCKKALSECFFAGDDSCANCSETDFPYRSAEDCSSTSFSTAYAPNDTALPADCGDSDAGRLSCIKDVKWIDAYEACHNAGGRLCTQPELESEASSHSGCNHDSRLIWSATSCAGGGFMAVIGSGLAPENSVCIEDLNATHYTGEGHSNRSIAVRCCADDD